MKTIIMLIMLAMLATSVQAIVLYECKGGAIVMKPADC
jgi:hypothetical protein